MCGICGVTADFRFHLTVSPGAIVTVGGVDLREGTELLSLQSEGRTAERKLKERR